MRHRTRGTLILGWILAALAPPALGAQMRPLEPFRWDSFEGLPGEVRFGAGFFGGQRASLAGTSGQLLELGTFGASLCMGRVSLELGGTAVRLFFDDSVYAEPAGGSRAPDGQRRQDRGEYRLSTLVLLTEPEGPAGAALRFGVKLPTSDNLEGLGRDQTDFFATLAGRLRRGPVSVSGEAGVGVFGTRDLDHEQVDPLLYAAGVAWDRGALRLRLDAVGQHDTRRGAELRGNEDLGEIRVGAEVGIRRLLRLVLVRGLSAYSPSFGLGLESALRF